MKKVFYLSTCDSNKRILKELNLSSKFIKQDIKIEPISNKVSPVIVDPDYMK